MNGKLLKLVALLGILSAVNLFVSDKVAAQQSPVIVGDLSIGGQPLNNQDGLNIAGGIGFRYQNFTTSLDLINVNLIPGNSSGFSRDTFKNGQSRCRNNSTGKFAKNSSCGGSGDVEFSFLTQLKTTRTIESTTSKNWK